MSIPTRQREVAALLGRITGAAPIETHISAVFVGPQDAFKLKKAVTLPFLDFAPLAARERFARRELELNRPNAPGIYKDVLPVTRDPDGRLALGGDGEVAEWVLRMAPVPADHFLGAIAARGGLEPALLDALADTVAALLAAAPVAEGVDAPARMARVLEGNIEGCLAAGLDNGQVAAVAEAMRARLAALAPLMAARAAAGLVRRCHGDLHLGNLCLWEGRPVAFDALEFDEALARIDTGYELAFLLMDLEVRLSQAAANRVMNRVLARSFDIGMLAALPFWMAQRALVRAKLEPARGQDGMPYLAAASRFPEPVPPRLVAVGGLQGTGKTWLARDVAPRLGVAPGALHLRSDEIRKRRAGVAPEQRLPPEAYAEAESRAVHAEMFAAARRALADGHSVVLDAVFLDPAHRAAAEAAAGDAAFAGIWLEAPLDVLRARVAGREGDASDATVAVLEHAARADPGRLTWHRMDVSGDARVMLRKHLALNGNSEA
ncbi:MAG TPA: AAA family ATPase [Falsiroseomonas sp.]|nr:AAA family ATPase [Falsiroseomonas sp.]